MRILMIGGTRFVGRAMAEAAIERGHDVTLFHRGQTNPDILPQATRVQGNRDGEIAHLGDGEWDVVIDTCGYVPRVVRQSADYLKEHVGLYIFISTISVYAESTEIGRDEDAPLATMDDPTVEEITGETYGALKVLCEDVVSEIYGDKALHIRPGFIVGPHDPSHRFTYWPVRTRRGGDMLLPDDGQTKVQVIDARDLADFTILRAESGTGGVYNTTGPATPYTIRHICETTQQITGSDVTYVSADVDWLHEQEVTDRHLPLWLPQPEGQALMQINIDRALAAGMSLRPLADTTRDTLAWYDASDSDPQTWLSADTEAALISQLR